MFHGQHTLEEVAWYEGLERPVSLSLLHDLRSISTQAQYLRVIPPGAVGDAGRLRGACRRGGGALLRGPSGLGLGGEGLEGLHEAEGAGAEGLFAEGGAAAAMLLEARRVPGLRDKAPNWHCQLTRKC